MADKTIKDLTSRLTKFRDDRDWSQFHDSKNLALALSLEASELNELFLWKKEAKDIESVDKGSLASELADIFAYGLLLVEKHGLDFFEIIEEKIKENDRKYPVEKAKGTATKYDKL